MARAIPRAGSKLTLEGEGLTVDAVAAVAREGSALGFSQKESVLRRIDSSFDLIQSRVAAGAPIYGVTTKFGSLGNVTVPKEEAEELQNNLLWVVKAGSGELLPDQEVRAAMVVHLNTLIRGRSGIRREIIERGIDFINRGLTPCVREGGSIGASGDLIPLGAIFGAVVGSGEAFRVRREDGIVGSITLLKELGLEPIRLAPKEGLALVNGTSASAGIAACCVHRARRLLALTLGIHALHLQALSASNEPFHPFIHQCKPHVGQAWVAEVMRELLSGSGLIDDALGRLDRGEENGEPQDRYSIRCLPQFIGPVVEGLARIEQQIETEINSVTDNPLVDADDDRIYHGGNFLGQYIATCMDELRGFLGLLGKHLDAQIALLVSPEYSKGLPASLIGNPDRAVNMGLKALQVSGNSLVPMLEFYGASLADRFPVHAEQFNQNINSQSYGSAILARKSLEVFENCLAINLIMAVQAVDLREFKGTGSHDPTASLSATTRPLYQAVREVLGRPADIERPLVWNDHEQSLEDFVELLSNDLKGQGRLLEATDWIDEHFVTRFFGS